MLTHADLFGHVSHKPKRKRGLVLTRPTVPEAAIVEAVLQLLAVHPAVAWACRQNCGAMWVGEGKSRRYVRFNSMPGMSDILGQLKGSGKLIVIECKRVGEKPTVIQQSFLDLVARGGGFSMVAYNAQEVAQELAKCQMP
jgi:hypothetical protein